MSYGLHIFSSCPLRSLVLSFRTQNILRPKHYYFALELPKDGLIDRSMTQNLVIRYK